MNHYFVIAGEASGDIHAARLIQALKNEQPEARFVGLGGDQMASAGCELIQHYRHMAYMGVAAVLANIGKVRENFRITREALLRERPKVLILIDYPSFNLRIASFCRKHLPDTKIVYYIPPKVWAWKSWRIHRIGRLCDLVLGIFPFEEAYYKERGYACTYVGNPTVEEMRDHTPSATKRYDIALLPGSRRSEIEHCLPVMLAAARKHSQHIVVSMAPGIEESFYAPYLTEAETLTRETQEAVSQAKLAIVNSGTATLETALIGTPQIAVYHLAASALLGLLRPLQRMVFPLPYFTLPNIILGRQIIPELLANEFTLERLDAEIRTLIHNETALHQMQSGYRELNSILGTHPAAATAARLITQLSRP